jgi:uncharacterized membrane protein
VLAVGSGGGPGKGPVDWSTLKIQAALSSLRRYFVTGLAIVLPSLLTLYIVWILFSVVGGLLSPFLSVLLRGAVGKEMAAPLGTLVSFLVTVTLICLVGMTGTLFSQRIFQYAETVFTRIPLVRGIYSSVRQLIDLFAGRDASFKKVAMLEFPRPGLYSLCFMTSPRRFDLPGRPGGAVCVFLPTAPNPTSGFFLLVPTDEVIPVGLTAEEALKLIVSGGAISPPGRWLFEEAPPGVASEKVSR